MRHIETAGITALAVLGGYSMALAQSQEPAPSADAAAAAVEAILVPAGTRIGLELQDSLNSKYTQKGESVGFKVSPEVLIGGRVAIARESTVEAVVSLARRAGPAHRKGELRVEFEKLVLADGTSLPLAARIARVGRWNRSSTITPAEPGDRDVLQDLTNLAQSAGLGAILGSMGGARGAAIGAGAGVAIGIVSVLMERGPEVDLPPGIMFQVELTTPLSVPVKAPVSQASATPPVTVVPAPATPPPQDEAAGGAPPAGIPKPPAETASVALNPAVPLPPVPIPQPADFPAAANEGTVTFKTEVNLVTVETTVRDARGALYIKLKREDFKVLEDGVEQEIRHFSRDELPLSVALVIDRSGSVAPIFPQLRRAGYQTLSQLKPGDEVALFAFDSRSELLQEFTTDRQTVTDSIARIQAGGGTNITDTLLDVARYMGEQAPERRHAIILVSDNQQTVAPRANDADVIRSALETETVVYGIKVAECEAAFPVALPRGGSVKRIAQETGGEVFEIRELGSVESAMQAVVTRLKLRFTLGYHRMDAGKTGAFRRIEVRVTKADPLVGPFTVYHRRGYYSPRPGRTGFPPPGAEAAPERKWEGPLLRRSASPAEGKKVERRPFTNDDVLRLVRAGFGEETILEAMRTSDCRFETSAEALVSLKNEGVSERILKGMLSAGRVSGSSPATSGWGGL